jgi:tetratricopeptide (TPR) repeat protein
MSQLEFPSIILSTLHQKALEALQQQQYAQASEYYEQLIEIDPETKLYYWEFGLAQLLQRNETEAQIIWTVALSEGEPEQVKCWTDELSNILIAEIDRQTDHSQEQLIRYHIHEINPTDLTNLLHLLSLSVKLEYSAEDDDVILPAIISLLRSNSASTIDSDLLMSSFQAVFEAHFTQPALFLFAEACIPHLTDTKAMADLLLEKLKLLSFVHEQNYLACKYAELCVQLPEHKSELLFRLSLIYYTLGEFAKSVEFAEQYATGCQTFVQKYFSLGQPVGKSQNTVCPAN